MARKRQVADAMTQVATQDGTPTDPEELKPLGRPLVTVDESTNVDAAAKAFHEATEPAVEQASDPGVTIKPLEEVLSELLTIRCAIHNLANNAAMNSSHALRQQTAAPALAIVEKLLGEIGYAVEEKRLMKK